MQKLQKISYFCKLKTNFPMDTNHLKLRLIELILQTENEQILLQILDILEKQISELSFEQIQELDRRLALLESGKMELIDADQVMDKLRRRVDFPKNYENTNDKKLLEEPEYREKQIDENPDQNLSMEDLAKKIRRKNCLKTLILSIF